jgi:DNA-damage-inducible protein J
MHKATTVKASIRPELKMEVEEVFKKLGLSTADAIVLFFYQVKLHSGLPFEIKIPVKRKIPNATTLKTFRDTDAGKNLVEYESIDEMFADLKS